MSLICTKREEVTIKEICETLGLPYNAKKEFTIPEEYSKPFMSIKGVGLGHIPKRI